jgi:hypothetical protein
MVFEIFVTAMLLQSAAIEPLPDHVDIPDEYSTIICPNQQSAKTMLEQYHSVKPAPNNYTIDITLFFEGLKATGCQQNGATRKGLITVKTVQQRKRLAMGDGERRFIRYGGVDATGKPVVGIVDEDGNNSFARTPLAQWLSERATDGWLDARTDRGQSWIFYRCDTPAKANAAVAATKGMENAKSAAFDKKLTQAAEQQGCRRATDRYQVTAILSTAGNNCGDECYVDLTALAATDRSGLSVGLIFDGSLM